MLLLVTPPDAFDVVVPFLVIGASALLAAQQRLKLWLGGGLRERPVALLTGTAVGGVYGGYFGGGLGVIFMALLGLTVAAPLAEINVLKGILQLLVATVSLLAFALFGPVDWVVVAVVAPLALLGAMIGGRVAQRMSETILRASVVTFGFVVGAWLALRAFG